MKQELFFQSSILPIVSIFLAVYSAPAANWYLATNGVDTNPGTQVSPFATIMQAQSKASSGDTVFINEGIYHPTNQNPAQDNGVYVPINLINKSGITYQAMPGTRPVFDCSLVNPTGLRVAAFWVTATGVTFQGFDVIGVQENITNANNQSLGFGIWGCKNCTWNQVNVHDAECVGFYAELAAANNLIYRCDSYNNTGINSFSFGNADGFGCHPSTGGINNVFRECRAWNNSDDGYDCINSSESVTFDHCWSYKNGNNGGDGNAFKIGGWASTPQNKIRNPVPVHTVRFCLAASTSSHGFYANHQPSRAACWTNNTSFSNGSADFDMLERTPPDFSSTLAETSTNDMAGTNELLRYNLAFGGTLVHDLNETGDLVASNSWTMSVTVSSADFLSTTSSQITNARAPDGSLPVITFMHLASGSDLTNLGCFLVPPAPINFSATVSNTQAALVWMPADVATGYSVKRSTTSGGPYTNVAFNIAPTNYTDTGLSYGVTYFYVVAALNPGDESANSVEVTATPQLPLPPFISSLSVASGNFVFSGTGGVASASFYLLGTTNLSDPMSNWARLQTNQFDGSGNFDITNAPDPDWPQGFFQLQLSVP